MKREVQLYISDTRVDLFQDETISITDSIQNISDISKIFTPFSQSFNLPASATNNKLFKHYYNFNIQDGFDARFRVDARIEISFVPFKTGQIRLDGVSMKDNKPHTYKVVFFGKPSNIKDIFGEEDLNSLNPLKTYDIDYNGNDYLNAFKTGLQTTGSNATTLANRNVVVPLILLNNYYEYDSGSYRLDTATWANLRKELKPAIKLKRVIEAIQTQYDITFNMADEGTIKTFFGSAMFDELYLWLHREKTPVSAKGVTPEEYGVDVTTRNKKLTFADYSYLCGSGDVLSSNKLTINEGESFSIRVSLAPSITTNTGEVIVKDITTNELLYYKNNIAFNSSSLNTITMTSLTSGTLSSRTYDIEIRINCQTGQTFPARNSCGTVAMRISKTVGATSTVHDYGNTGFSLGYNIYIQDYLPKMKVLDFLTALFKMFNLVAYTKLTSSTIYVETFDDYMTKGVTRDITKYIDVTQSTIDRPVPFNQVNFKYAEPVTQTGLRFLNQFSLVFGNLGYSAPEKYDGQAFNLDVPLERTVLINLQDSSGDQTNNIQGWWVDAEGKPTLGKPYIFFNRVVDSSSYPLTSLTINEYNAPSNVATDQNHTLSFGAEYDEFNGDINTNSIFERFYKEYIIQTFQQNGRIIKVTAHLPLEFILNYSVNDVILISGELYYINSIKINLTTGKSDLELIVKTTTYTNSVLT